MPKLWELCHDGKLDEVRSAFEFTTPHQIQEGHEICIVQIFSISPHQCKYITCQKLLCLWKIYKVIAEGYGEVLEVVQGYDAPKHESLNMQLSYSKI